MLGSVGEGRRRLTAVAMSIVAVVVLFAACAPPPSDPGSPPTTTAPLPDPPGRFSVLTYNVAGLPQEISDENPRRNIPRISPLLNAYDVVLTQEDFDWWVPALSLLDFANYHTRLRADAAHPYRTDRHPGPAAVGVNPNRRPLLVGDGIGIMSMYPLLDARVWAWSDCFGGPLPPGAADCLAMKGFRVVTMVLGDDHLVDVYSLHAEAGATRRDQDLQYDNFRELAEFIESHSGGRAVIVGGDTNLHLGDHPDGWDGEDAVIWADFLARTGLADVCTELDCDEPHSIDKFAYRSGGGVDLVATSIDFPRDRFRDEVGRPLSDHPPVVATFDWDAAGGGGDAD